jgi:hypothetical protein
MSSEHFIPFRKTDIVSMCADELDPAERESFHGFAKMLASLLHHRFYDRIEALKDAYHPFNPQSDTRHLSNLDPDQRAAARRRLEEELAAVARAANFTQIDPAEFDRAFSEHSLFRVRLAVDLDAVEKLILFRRGESTVSRELRTLYGLRRQVVTFTNYARVLVYARFKEAEHFDAKKLDRLPFSPGSTIIKLFQNVPRPDMEMVLPNVQVRMRGIDKLLIGVPAFVSAIVVIVTKLIASIGLLLVLLAFWLGLSDKQPTISQTGLFTLGAGTLAVGGYLIRQVTNFKNRKILFMKALSENLYFRNLDNDAGVFHHLLDAAEEAEVTEAVLAYHFLRTAAAPMTPSELDSRIETWFAQRWRAPVDYEIEDGLRKLRQLSLVTEDGEGRLAAVGLAEAKQHMDHEWDLLFTYDNRQPAAAA